jgi:hypothetical protein
VARQGKKNGQWFVGGVTDDNKRTLAVPFSFLEPGKTYEATIYHDAEDADYKDNPQAYNIYKVNVSSESILDMTMARGGGFAISLEEK